MSIKTKTISVFLSVATVLCMSGAMTPMAASAALTQAQIDAIISLLQSFGADQTTISNVQTSLTGGTPSGTTGGAFTFATDLKMGSTGTDVKNLQIVLNKDAATQVAASGVGSSGNETTTFGPLTKAAVIKFQNKYASEVLTPIGLSAGTGYVGSMSRAKLNTITGGVVTPITPGVTPQGTGLTVTTGVQPLASLAPMGATRIPMTVVNFTASADGDVTVNSLTVERTGLAADAAISGVILLDENGVQLGLEKTLNSLHQAILSEPFTVKAGQTRAMTIAINRPAYHATTNTGYSGQIAYFALVAVNTSAAVHGALPITGTGMTINESLQLGSVDMAVGSLDPGTGVVATPNSKNIGITGFVFSSIKVTAGAAEKVRLMSIRWNQSGSAAAGDLANVATYVDNTAYSTTVSSDGKYYTTTFGSGIVIDKGLSKEISIKGDIVGGSARTIEFDLYKATDLALKGETYGYGILPATTGAGTQGYFASTASGNPYFWGRIVQVSAGTLAVSKATSIAAQNIAINLANQPLGGFDVEVKGETVSVGKMIFDIATSTAGYGYLTNVSLYDQNGAVVAGPVNAVYSAPTIQKVTFTDTVTFPIGKYTYILKGQLPTTADSGETFIVSVNPYTAWTTVKGQTTGVTIYPSPDSTITASTMTTKTAAVAITVSGTPASQSVVAGAQNFIFSNYQFDGTASGEDVRFNSLKLKLTVASEANYLTGCTLYDGSTALNTGSNVPTLVSGSGYSSGLDVAFTLGSGGLVIPKGTVKTIALKCNISANATATYYWGITAHGSTAQTGTGLISGQEAAVTTSADAGPAMAVTDKGTMAASQDSSAPSYAIIPAGITGWTDGAVKFTATNEDVNLQYVELTLNKGSAYDVIKVYLYDGATKVAEGIFAGTSATTLLTLNPTVIVPKDGHKVLTVKADINTIDSNTAAVREGAQIQIDFNSGSNTTGIGLASATTIIASGADTGFAGARIFKSYPTFVKLAVPSTTLITSTMDLYRFSIAANPASANGIGLYKLYANIATSTGDSTVTVKNLKVYAYTDSGFSNPVSSHTNGLVVANIASFPSGFVALSIANSSASIPILQIPAGGTTYFRVIGDTSITGGSLAPSGSVSTYIVGDNTVTTATLMATAAYTASSTCNGTTNLSCLAWSPNATTTSATTHSDWTNGYGVSGLPSTGMDSVTIYK